MKLKLALVAALVITLFVVASDMLAFCTGWCALPASILGAPGSLVGFAANAGLAIPAPLIASYIVTFIAWFAIVLFVLSGLRRSGSGKHV